MKKPILRYHSTRTFIVAAMLSAFFVAFSISIQSDTDVELPVISEKKPLVDFPDTAVKSPTILVKNDQDISVPLRVSHLDVRVEVIGQLAQTTMEITFANDLDRMLEGTFFFPLNPTQTLSKFALEVEGEMREGVFVEKDKGRAIFESVTRKQIDPGLLEWSKGNNFKARVYPIPARGKKRIMIQYIQELDDYQNQRLCQLPLAFKDQLESLSIELKLKNESKQPVLDSLNPYPLQFKAERNDLVARVANQHVFANQTIQILLPGSTQQQPLVAYDEQNNGYFYATVHPKKETRIKTKPTSLTVLWDVSGSAESRDAERELLLLKDYLSYLKNTSVQLISFSNQVHTNTTTSVTSENVDQFIQTIRKFQYDGGTQLGCIAKSKITGKEILLVSDCLTNFGPRELNVPENTRVYVWNSQLSCDPLLAEAIAAETGGEYLDLNKWSNKIALEHLKTESLQFLGASTVDGIEFANNQKQSVKDYFSISGKGSNMLSSIQLKFGYGNVVTEEIILPLERGEKIENTSLLQKIWAQKRLDVLQRRPKPNKPQIEKIGKEYGMVTQFTSLLVLDNLEDYVQYEVEPPHKMKAAYLAALKKKNQTKVTEEKEHLAKVEKRFNEIKTWWDTDFKPKPIEEKKKSSLEEGSGSYNFYQLEPVANGSTSNFTVPHETFVNSIVSNSAMDSESMDKSTGGPSANVSVNVANWDPQTPYLKKLNQLTPEKWYAEYLNLKRVYGNQPSFFIDVSDFFIEKKDPSIALRILSNIAEMQLDDPQLLRILAHRLEQLKYFSLAVSVFKEVKELRPEEPQSFRDLGLAYAAVHSDQKAIDELNYVVNHVWDDRFNDIEVICLMEMNNIIAQSRTKLNLYKIPPSLQRYMPVDMRVIITWDTDNCDIDLWVTDPRGEKCFYSNQLTELGGRISDDFTGGYGPEEFMIRKAIPGQYKVQANYFGSSAQTISGLTTVQVKFITNYGRSTEKTVSVTRRLEEKAEVIDLADFEFGGKDE